MQNINPDSSRLKDLPSETKPQKKLPSIKSAIIVFVIVATLFIIVVIGYYFVSILKTPKDSSLMETSGSTEELQQATQEIPPASPLPDLSPTPRPTGPGTYACSPQGVCNHYKNPENEEFDCPVTFADLHCLDQCEDLTKRCKK